MHKIIEFLKLYLIAIICFLLFDGIWLSSTNNWLYRPIINAVNAKEGQFRWLGAITAWKLLAFIVTVFTICYSKDMKSAVIGGGLIGLSIYGVFNATNYAIFPEWTFKVSLYDTFWGMTVCSLVAIILHFSKKYLFSKASKSVK